MSGGSRILVFTLGGARFALRVDDVLEIVRAAAPARLPGAPAVVAGVLDVRGALAPVFDVRGRFGLPPRDLDPADHMVVVRAGPRRAVLAVEQVEALVDVPAEALASAEAVATRTGCLAGVARLPDGTVAILDLAAFLSEAEGAALDAALAP